MLVDTCLFMSCLHFHDLTLTHLMSRGIIYAKVDELVSSGLYRTAPPNAEESYNQMCRRNGLDLGWYGKCVMVERNDTAMVARNGSEVDRHVGFTCEIAHTNYKLASHSRKNFAQDFQS